MTTRWITDPYRIPLTAHEVEELINIGSHGIVDAGSTISHSTAHALRDKGLAQHFGNGYSLTIAGQKWFNVLLQSGALKQSAEIHPSNG